MSRALQDILSVHWGEEDTGPPTADNMRYLLLKPVTTLCAEPAMLKVTVHRQTRVAHQPMASILSAAGRTGCAGWRRCVAP